MQHVDIKHRIYSLGAFPPDEDCIDTIHYLLVANKRKKFGMLDADHRTLLPFRFDNISIIGFGLFLLIKRGKMGLLYIKKTEDGVFYVKKQIPCEYDYIETHDLENTVVLTRTTNQRTRMRVYLTAPDILTDEYQYVNYIDSNYMQLCDGTKRDIIDARTGEARSDDGEFFCLGSFPVENGTLFEEATVRDEGRLVFLGNDGNARYSATFIDECNTNVIQSNINANGKMQAMAFIADTEDGFVILSDNASELSCERFDYIKVNIELLARTSGAVRTMTIPVSIEDLYSNHLYDIRN